MGRLGGGLASSDRAAPPSRAPLPITPPLPGTLIRRLQYVPGGSIASMLGRFGRFSEDLVRNYTRQLLLGLEYLHGCRIVHRDLKVGRRPGAGAALVHVVPAQ